MKKFLLILVSHFLGLFLLYASPLFAGQSGKDFTIPDNTYLASGSPYVFTSASLANETLFSLMLVKTYWTNSATTLNIMIEISTDNGKTYIRAYEALVVSGTTPAMVFFHNTQAGTRRIKFTFTLNNDLRTSGVFHAE